MNVCTTFCVLAYAFDVWYILAIQIISIKFTSVFSVFLYIIPFSIPSFRYIKINYCITIHVRSHFAEKFLGLLKEWWKKMCFLYYIYTFYAYAFVGLCVGICVPITMVETQFGAVILHISQPYNIRSFIKEWDTGTHMIYSKGYYFYFQELFFFMGFFCCFPFLLSGLWRWKYQKKKNYTYITSSSFLTLCIFMYMFTWNKCWKRSHTGEVILHIKNLRMRTVHSGKNKTIVLAKIWRRCRHGRKKKWFRGRVKFFFPLCVNVWNDISTV